MSQQKIIIYLAHSLFLSPGGVQSYSRQLLEALLKFNHDCQLHVFTQLDISTKRGEFSLPYNFFCFGNTPKLVRQIKFAATIFLNCLSRKPKLIIVTHPNLSPLAYILSRLLGIPYWVVAHGIDVWYIQKVSVLNALIKANLVIAVSDYTRQRLLKEQPIAEEKVKVLANTFDPKKFVIAPKPQHLLNQLKLRSEQAIILTVTRLAQDKTGQRTKGYDEIIRALPAIIDKIPNVHYVLVGKGDDQARIEKLVQELEVERYITLAGYVSDEELPQYFQLCDIYAMPSRGEGFGIVFLEALASGKPTMGGNQDGAISALCNGELGALVNPDDIKEIADTLVSILQGNYPNLLMYQPEQLRKKVIEAYGFESFKNNLAQLLNTQNELVG